MIDTKIVMEILVEWAKNKDVKSYSALSNCYLKKTGEDHKAHGTWDKPLGILNRKLAELGAPALSALVIVKNKNEPGGKFWGCASNVPARPKTDDDRMREWKKILDSVFLYDWEKVSLL